MELPKHDRPLTKYPEVAMTANSSGGYVVSASSTYSTGNYPEYEAFNNIFPSGNDGGTEGWISGEYRYSGTATNGEYLPVGNDTFSGAPSGEQNGSWIKLQLPKKIKLDHLVLKQRYASSGQEYSASVVVYASVDNSNWQSLGTFDPSGSETFTFYTNSSYYYNYFVLHIKSVNHEFTYAAIEELEYWGYEEGDESVDVVHRSIPNKPGQQHLEVYWDANDSNSYSFVDSANVYDLSGNGVTATISGAKGFNAKYNSWILNNNLVDYISSTLSHSTGAWVHSVSTWMYRYPTTSTNQQNIFQFGTTVTSEGCATRFEWISGQWMIRYYFMNNDVIFYLPHSKLFEKWIHITATYDGGSDSGVVNGSYGLARKLYVNGVPCEVQSSYQAGSLNLATTSSTFYLGHRPSAGSLIGEVANARVYSKALSADQARELYEYEAARFDHREDLVSLHKGNLGIGLRDPEQRLVVKPQTDMGYFPQTQVYHTGDFAYLHDNRSNSTRYNIWTEKDGLLVVDCSSYFAGGDSNPLYPFQVLNATSYRWQDAGGTYSTTNGSYTGGSATTVDGTSRSGEWIEVIFGQPIAIEKFIMNVNLGGDFQVRGAKTGVIAARNYEDESWTAVYEMSGQSWVLNQNYEFVPTSSVPYKHYRFVIETITAGTYGGTATLTTWEFYGKYASTSNGAVFKTGSVESGGVIANAVCIGGKSCEAPLTVKSLSGHFTSANRQYFNYDTGANTITRNTGDLAKHSIYAEGSIVTRQYIVSHSGTAQSSDRRIKTEITDVNDSSALDTFRLIQPKLYNYKDVVQKGTLPVWGFIAQEVGDVLNYSTHIGTEYIPNVYELANVYAEGVVLEFDTTKLQPGVSKLRLYDSANSELDAFIDEIIDEYTVRLTKPIEIRDQVFVYGQEVRDFHFLKKDAIWTTAAAALQEVDRRQQRDNVRIRALENKDLRVKRPLKLTEAQGKLVDVDGALCAQPESKSVLGVVGATQGVVETSGEHYVWVCDERGSIEVGDYLTTSNVVGYATKQDDDLRHNYTVAKVLEPCDFTQPQVPSKRVLTETKNVNYYVHTSNVSLDVYSNLTVDMRTTLTETYYEKTTKVLVKYNEYVSKLPPYDAEFYYKLNSISASREVYDTLPDNERDNYVVESTVDGEPHTYIYRYDVYLTLDEWRDLDEADQPAYKHGYFKYVVEERTEPTQGFTEKSRTIYQKILNTINEPRNGYRLLVRQEQVPVLDAFGNLQYQEDPTEVVDAYELRYVDATGNLTTRHNAVYLAARIRCLLV